MKITRKLEGPLKMFKQQLNEIVDINLYPSLDQSHLAQKNVQFIKGDLHGNALNLVYLLVRHGVMKITATDYATLVSIYNTDTSQLTFEQLNKFKSIISKAQINNNALITLIGDVVSDRGQNDYFTLIILDKLAQCKVPLEIMFSNHDAEFVHAYEKQTNFNPEMLQGFGISMMNMQDLIEKGWVKREEIIKLINNCYKPNLKLIGYTLSDDKNEIMISTHAGIGLTNIKFIAKKLGVQYKDKTALELAQTINNINLVFKNYVNNNKINNLLSREALMAGFSGKYFDKKMQEKFPIEHLIWNRFYNDLDRPNVHNGYKINFIHGHDSHDPLLEDHLYNVDNILGKALAYHQAPYNILYSNKTVAPVHKPAQPVHKPAQPVHKPAQPVHKPAQPVHKPAQPVHKPAQPVHKPAQPVHKPAQPIHKPVQHLMKQQANKPAAVSLFELLTRMSGILKEFLMLQVIYKNKFKNPITQKLYEAFSAVNKKLIEKKLPSNAELNALADILSKRSADKGLLYDAAKILAIVQSQLASIYKAPQQKGFLPHYHQKLVHGKLAKPNHVPFKHHTIVTQPKCIK